MFCINLCELLNYTILQDEKLDEIIDECKKNNNNDNVERIYIGSSFCSQYFLNNNCLEKTIEYCNKKQLKVTLTLPVFTQKDLVRAKEMIAKLLNQNVIDEVTVNDYGMLSYISQNYSININLGRLFFKDPRDIRVKDYFESEISPALLSFDITKYKIKGIELDNTNEKICVDGIDHKIQVGVHTPYCFMTTGQICKFASIHKELSQKFRPNTSCQMECLHILEHYEASKDDHNFNMERIGRTIYFRTPKEEIIGQKIDREIYFPVKETVDIMKEGAKNEHISTSK